MPVKCTLKDALRAAYKRLFWTHLSYVIIFFVSLTVILAIVPLVWIIPVCVCVVTIVDYALERLMLRKGKNPLLVFSLLLIVPPILLLCGVFPGATAAVFMLYFPTFLLVRTLIPLILLLRDGALLRKGKFCESTGRRKENTRRMDNSMTREYYVLFQDESTRQTHLIRMECMSSVHRYRVLYLPHSGVAVGEIIPRRHRKKSNSDEALSVSAENHPCDTRFDPNSPERQLAAKYGKAEKVCRVLATVLGVGGFCCAALLRFPLALLGGIISLIVLGIVAGHMNHKNLKLRCTEPTTARCFDTIKRGAGRYSTHHPIVEYAVDGVTYTKELPISCSSFDVGKLYTIYYDPLDPETVRAE